MIFDFSTALIIAATFLLAGAVKGVIGLGLPTVSLGLLTVTLDLTTAMALLIVPSFMTNLWQALVGGNLRLIARRIWPFLILATACVWPGSLVLGSSDLSMLAILLGVLLLLYASIGLVGFRFSVSAQREMWAGPVFGVLNGVLTGMTGSFVVPGVMYLQAIGLSRDQLVQAMGILFTLSTLALGLALRSHNLITIDAGIASSLALVPAIVGMVVGRRLRSRMSEQLFRQVFFCGILLLGAYIVMRNL